MYSQSRKYYESKVKQNKELKFFHSKCEGLKQCLKEAKETYQKALKNLEKISDEIHGQRNGIQKIETDTSDLKISIDSQQKPNEIKNQTSNNKTSNFQFSQKKYGVSQMSDEEIEYLRLDEFLKNYENELKVQQQYN